MARWQRRCLVPLVILLEVQSQPGNLMRRVLLAGQSNMVGWPEQAGNFYRGPQYETIPIQNWANIMEFMNLPVQKKTNGTFFANLFNMLVRTELYTQPRAAEIAKHQASLLIELDETYPKLFENMWLGRTNMRCAYDQPPAETSNFMGTSLLQRKKCGEPYGLEVSMGHTLSQTEEMVLAKVASGGSQLKMNWTKAEGNFWDTLERRISTPFQMCQSSDTCSWDAFVWFQGEHESLAPFDPREYFDDLRGFVADVRSEMYAAGTRYETREEIPVVLIQVGAWAQGLPFGRTIAQVQQLVSSWDPHMALVTTDDLSEFYHYDAASQIIIGERVTRALQWLWSIQLERAGEDQAIEPEPEPKVEVDIVTGSQTDPTPSSTASDKGDNSASKAWSYSLEFSKVVVWLISMIVYGC